MPFIDKAIAIIAGSFILAIGINVFLIPYHLLDGGFIGIGLLVKYIFDYKAGGTIIVLSIPIFVIAWLQCRTYFYNSLHGMLISSLMIDLLYPFHVLLIEFFWMPALLSSVIGGILVGVGIGMMLKKDTSTGGTDLIAQLIATKLNKNVGVVIFVIDFMIICIGGVLISQDTFLLSILTVLTIGFTTSLCTWNKQTG